VTVKCYIIVTKSFAKLL